MSEPTGVTNPEDERPADPTETQDDEPQPDADRARDDLVVGLGVDDADREVPEPNEPA